MRFPQVARAARDNGLPLRRRFRAFLSALVAYRALARSVGAAQSFTALYQALGERHGFSWQERPTAAHVEAALAELEARRALLLDVLATFARTRRAAKRQGRRTPTARDWEAARMLATVPGRALGTNGALA